MKRSRKTVCYWVACDCQECLEGNGRFQCLSCGYDTEQGARRELKNGEYYGHDSLFVAKEVTEAIDPLPQRNPKRKAA